MIYSIQIADSENTQASYGKEYVQSIQSNINRNLDKLDALVSFYDASEFVDRQEFTTFTDSFITSNPNIQALAWIPNVPSIERIAFEEQARLDGLDRFRFKEIGKNGRLNEAGSRDQYFPVYYIAPMNGNERVFGFDLASHDERLAALTKAFRSQKYGSLRSHRLGGRAREKHRNISFFIRFSEDTDSEYTSVGRRV